MSTFLLRTFFIITCCLSTLASAQEMPDVSVKDILKSEEQKEQPLEPIDSFDSDEIPEDEFNRGVPRTSLYGFLFAGRNNDFTTAAQHLDFRNIKPEILAVGKEELARQLYVVLNRTTWIDLDLISIDILGHLDENVPSYRDLITQIETVQGDVPLLLQRIPRKGDKVKIWKVSNATVSQIPLLYNQYSYTPFGEWLAKELPPAAFLGVMLWQWVYFFLLISVYYVIAKVITWLSTRVISRFNNGISSETQKFIEKPLAILLALLLTRAFIPVANLTPAAKAVSEGATLLSIAWLWVIYCFIDLMKVHLAKRFVGQDKPLAVYLLRPAGTVLKSIITLVVLLIWFENLGFSATTLLAGLGIGGIAIALAAQKTVENIIGAITLYISAPVKIGNLCKFGGYIGTVEEIGLRATRIRTLNRTVIHVANAQFVDMELENYSERERIAFRPVLRLIPDCKTEDLQALLGDIKVMLEANDKVSSHPLRIHLKEITVLGLELEVLSYIDTTDFELYLNTINEINLNIFSLIEKNNCKLLVVNEPKGQLLS